MLQLFTDYVKNFSRSLDTVVRIGNRKKSLQQVHKNFAYEVLALEAAVHESEADKSNDISDNITSLAHMYMLAVETLESNEDKRYRYFQTKIELLMRKRFTIEQLVKKSQVEVKANILMEVLKKSQGIDRKEQHQVEVQINAQHFDSKKIKEMVKNAEERLGAIRVGISSELKTQNQTLENRIKLRKMKSDCGSVRMFNEDSPYRDQYFEDISVAHVLPDSDKILPNRPHTNQFFQ